MIKNGEGFVKVYGEIALKEDTSFKVYYAVRFYANDIEITYKHVMTGSDCGSVCQVLQGWSDQDYETQNKWSELVERIDNNDDLIDIIGFIDEEDEDFVMDFAIDSDSQLEQI